MGTYKIVINEITKIPKGLTGMRPIISHLLHSSLIHFTGDQYVFDVDEDDIPASVLDLSQDAEIDQEYGFRNGIIIFSIIAFFFSSIVLTYLPLSVSSSFLIFHSR